MSPQTLLQQPSWDSWLFSCPVGQLFKGAVGKTWSKQSCNYFYDDLFKEVLDSRGRSGERVVADQNSPPCAEISSTPGEKKKQAVSCLPQFLPSSASSNCLQTPRRLLKANESQGIKEIGKANQFAMRHKLMGPVEMIHGRLGMLAYKGRWIWVGTSATEAENFYDFWSC